MLTFVILQIATALFLAGLGVGIWLQQRTKLRFGLLLFTLSLALWIGFGVLANFDTPYALHLNRLVFIFPLWIVFAAGYLITQMAQTKGLTEAFTLVSAALITGVAVLTDALVIDISPRINEGVLTGYDVVRGFLYPAYLILLVVSASLILTKLYLAYRVARGVKRDQLLVVGIGFIGTLVAGLVLAVLLPLLYNSSEIAEYSFLAGLISAASFTYAIVKHGLFDIKLAIIRTIAYVFSLGTLSLSYFTMAYVASLTVFAGNLSTGFSVSPANIALALILAFLFQPIKQFFDKTTDKIFFKDRYNTDEFIARLSDVITSTTDLRNLLQRAALEIGTTLKAEQAFFMLEYGNDRHMTAGSQEHATIPTHDFEFIVAQLSKRAGETAIYELLGDEHALKKIMHQYDLEIIMTIGKQGVTSGFLALGHHKTSRYTGRDVRVLQNTADELMIAIQNSLSIQEVRDINTHLQQRIEEATLELRHSNSQLKKLDASKDEFISMASHQLRTPLTAVKGYVSMILEGDIGKITPQQREVLEQAYDSSQRMVFLIGDFLNVSRLQTGKFVLEPSTINFTKLVEEEVDQLKDTARARHITLNYEVPDTAIIATADENKLRQVMMNFMDNAIFYSPSGKSIDVQLYRDAEGIVFRVNDHGIGVPKAEQAKLFTKFFRAGNAKQQRPDGTGIGIYMAKKVVLAHGGTLIFESTEGVGSTFGFKLPLKNDLDQLNKQPDTTASDTKHDS